MLFEHLAKEVVEFAEEVGVDIVDLWTEFKEFVRTKVALMDAEKEAATAPTESVGAYEEVATEPTTTPATETEAPAESAAEETPEAVTAQ